MFELTQTEEIMGLYQRNSRFFLPENEISLLWLYIPRQKSINRVNRYWKIMGARVFGRVSILFLWSDASCCGFDEIEIKPNAPKSMASSRIDPPHGFIQQLLFMRCSVYTGVCVYLYMCMHRTNRTAWCNGVVVRLVRCIVHHNRGWN